MSDDLRRRRILFVVNEASFFVSHRLPLAVAARDAGYDVHVVAPRRGPAVQVIERAGVPVHDLPLDRSGGNPLAEAITFRALVALYRRLRPDLVHHVTVKPVIYGSLAARVARVPAVVNAVSGLGYVFIARGWSASLRRRLVRTAYRTAFAHPRHRTIFQNVDDAASFIDRGLLSASHTVLIPGSGVDLNAFRATPEPPGSPVVVLPARLIRDKGVGEFVEAARQLRREGIDARFALVGDTDANRTAVSRDELRAWHDEGVVEWWGRRDDMPQVLSSAAIVCLPSYREGLSKLLLEAAASGRPAVTTDVPGCRDAVTDGETGLLVPARDSRALADALRTLLSAPERRSAMGRAARIRAEAEFGVERVVSATLAIYRELFDAES